MVRAQRNAIKRIAITLLVIAAFMAMGIQF